MARHPDTAVHIVSQSDKVVGHVSYAANGFRAVTGLQAFRGYNWMTDVRTANTAGNFRGMVVSARWATAYEVVAPAAKLIGNVATVASIAANAIDMAPQFEAVYRSNDSAANKGLRYTSLAGTVAQKTLAGIVVSGVHLIYLPLILACNAAPGAAGGSGITTAQGVCSVVKNADALVKNTANYRGPCI